MSTVATLPTEGHEVSFREIDKLGCQLEAATDPGEIKQIEARLDGIERYARQAGLYSTEQIRPINEMRMRARWKLGRALANVERRQGARTDLTVSAGLTKFRSIIKELGIDRQTALETQRIGSMPESELEKVLTEARKAGELNRLTDLIARAKPYWYKEQRSRRHQAIQAAAEAEPTGSFGPFSLIYADPPWLFETYTAEGHESNRMPDQHYPTMTDGEIAAFTVGGKTVRQFAATPCGLLLWCTSSNIIRAHGIAEAWGFEYKTQAVWDKQVIGTGLIFRNQHEVLLYAVKGDMPKPLIQPSSVFSIRRGEHSVKPPQVRATIEKMFPYFDATTRVELFSRGQHDGWTCRGFESNPVASAKRP